MGVGQNGKLGNLRNFALCSRSYWNFLVFVLVDFFLAFLNLELQSVSLFKVNEISEISEFSILGAGQNRKLGNLGNLCFFLFNHIKTSQFFAQFIKRLLDTLKLSGIKPVFE